MIDIMSEAKELDVASLQGYINKKWCARRYSR